MKMMAIFSLFFFGLACAGPITSIKDTSLYAFQQKVDEGGQVVASQNVGKVGEVRIETTKDRGILEQPIFWIVVAGLLAGGIVGGVVAADQLSGPAVEVAR